MQLPRPDLGPWRPELGPQVSSWSILKEEFSTISGHDDEIVVLFTALSVISITMVIRHLPMPPAPCWKPGSRLDHKNYML